MGNFALLNNYQKILLIKNRVLSVLFFFVIFVTLMLNSNLFIQDWNFCFIYKFKVIKGIKISGYLLVPTECEFNSIIIFNLLAYCAYKCLKYGENN